MDHHCARICACYIVRLLFDNFLEIEMAKRGFMALEEVVVDKRCSAVHRGVSYDGRFVGGGARNQEPDGDTRHRDSDLDRFGPSDRRNTLRPVSLLYCIEYEMYQSIH